MNIDIHAHYVPQALLDDLVAKRHGFSSVKTTAEKSAIRVAFNQEEPKRPVIPAMSDAALRRRWLEEQSIEDCCGHGTADSKPILGETAARVFNIRST